MAATLFAGADCVRLLLERGADPNARNAAGATALMWAAANSQGPMARLLLESGAKVDAKTATDLMTPLVSGATIQVRIRPSSDVSRAPTSPP